MKRCYLCKRRMIHYTSPLSLILHNRVDCGGDCWRCIKAIEEEGQEDLDAD